MKGAKGHEKAGQHEEEEQHWQAAGMGGLQQAVSRERKQR